MHKSGWKGLPAAGMMTWRRRSTGNAVGNGKMEQLRNRYGLYGFAAVSFILTARGVWSIVNAYKIMGKGIA